MNTKTEKFKLSCHCGQFLAQVSRQGLNIGNHLVCYCESCREFPRKIGCNETYVDEFGGSRIFQLPPACVSITQGQDKLDSLKLTTKGPTRWFTTCCRSPIANTMTPAMPFLALIIPRRLEGLLESSAGPIKYHVNTDNATKTLSADRPASNTAGFILRFLGQMFSWRLRGLNAPRPF